MSFGQMGKQYWKDELQKMMDIKSGATLPQETPEFKGMANMFNDQSNNQMANVLRQMSQRGITGGAAAGAIGSMDENNKSGLLKMIQNIFAQVNQRGGMAADKGMDWQKFLMNYDMQKDQMDSQQKMGNMKMITDLVRGGMGMAAGGLMGMGGAPAATPAAGQMTGGIAPSGGLYDWYNKMYGSPYLK